MNYPIGLLLAALGLAPSLAQADTCPAYFSTPPKVSTEQSHDGAIARVVRNYGGHYVYALAIYGAYGDIPGSDGARYRLQVTLNGKTSVVEGEESCTTVYAAAYSNLCDYETAGGGAGSTTPTLFFYAVNGDHLNAWDIKIHGFKKDGSVDPAGTTYRFPQKQFTELTWE